MKTHLRKARVGKMARRYTDDSPGYLTRNGLGSLEVGAFRDRTAESFSAFRGVLPRSVRERPSVSAVASFAVVSRFGGRPITGTPSCPKWHSPIGSTLGGVPRLG